MNHHLQSFAREFIMDGLNHLPREWVDKFRRIYLPQLVDPTIEDMAYAISDGSLDNAMSQVEKSLHTFKVQCGYTPRKLITNGTPDIQPGDRVDFGPIERWSSRMVLIPLKNNRS